MENATNEEGGSAKVAEESTLANGCNDAEESNVHEEREKQVEEADDGSLPLLEMVDKKKPDADDGTSLDTDRRIESPESGIVVEPAAEEEGEEGDDDRRQVLVDEVDLGNGEVVRTEYTLEQVEIVKEEEEEVEEE